MIKLLPRAIGILLFLFLAKSVVADSPVARLEESQRSFLKSYCVSCHNGEKTEGMLRLDDISFTLDSVQRAEQWQKVLNQINAGEMPPDDAKQPEAQAKTEFLDALSRALVVARKSLSDVQGIITMRRLNRREYKNTIRDLLGVELRVNELPADGGAGTFDTVGASLFMSSDQFEQYLELGRQALDEHFARQESSASGRPRRLHVEVEEKENPRITKGLQLRTDEHDRYVKWTTAIDAAASLPDNLETSEKIRAERKNDQTYFYSQWQRIPGAPSPKDFGFIDPVNADEQGRRDWEHYVPHHRAYVQHPLTKKGTFLTVDDVYVNPRQTFRLPGDWPSGDYVVRVRIAALEGTAKERRFVEFGPLHDSGVGAAASTHEITGTPEVPQLLEIPLKFSTDKERGYFFRERGTSNDEGAGNRIFGEARQRNGVGPEFALWIDWIEVEQVNGPTAKSTASRTLRKDPEQWANKQIPIYAQGYAEKHARYQQWIARVDEAAKKPENEEVVKKLREDPKVKRTPHMFYDHSAEIVGAPPPTEFGFKDVNDAQFARKEFEFHHQYHVDYERLPQRDTGAYLMLYSRARYAGIQAPDNWPAGKYLLRLRLAATNESPKERRFIELGTGQADASDFNVLSSHQVTGTLENPQTIEIPVEITATGDRNFVVRDKRPNTRDAEFAMFREAWDKTGTGPRPCIWIDFVELTGPIFETTAAPKIERVEVERKNDEMKRQAVYSASQHANFEKWKAAGAVEQDLPKFGFPTRYHADYRNSVWEGNHEWVEKYLARPEVKTGMFLDNSLNETSEFVLDLPAEFPTGEYVLRLRIGRVPNMPSERAFLTFVEASPIDKDDRTFLANKQITAEIGNPEIIELPFRILPGGPRKFILFEKRPLKKEDISLGGRTRAMKDPQQREPVLWIDWVEYEGPLNKSEGRERLEPVIFANDNGASDSEHARAIIRKFALRAFRGQEPDSHYVDKLVALYEARRKLGEPLEVAIREPLSVVLASPSFLYLSEPGAEDERRALTALELATRLSYFLWSAPPDERLLELARRDELLKPEVLTQEVDRLIASDKANEFVSGFVHQWLDMERLDFFQFDTKQFRDFDESTKAAARREVYETFAHLLRNKQSLARLLKSDEVFVNGLLATYYDLEGVSGDEFQRLKLPANTPRGGLLGMAAIHAMGSNGQVSSPVERGAWVLRKLLHDPPPPAPKNVPQLSRLENQLLTTRERLIAHQHEPQCLQCHRKIDPIGFGLENFNAAGKWRTEETYEKRGVGKKTWAIDPSGKFHNGPAFTNYFELRDQIAAQPERFARGFTEALIEYSLGRPYGFTDDALATRIVAHAAQQDFTVSDFIQTLVASPEFHRK